MEKKDLKRIVDQKIQPKEKPRETVKVGITEKMVV